MTKRNNHPAHKHEWHDRGTRDWRYVCSICGGKSRNNCYQPRAFRETSALQGSYVYWDFTSGAVKTGTYDLSASAEEEQA